MTLRLAIVGAGAIADFHAPAFRHAGFDLAVVASRPGSTSVAGFAERHGIPVVAADVDDVVRQADQWDAVLVAVPTVDTIEVLDAVLAAGKPVLVEKPVGVRSAEVVRFASSDVPVLVGYNRRYYPAVQRARREVANRPPLIGQLTLPEGIAPVGTPDRERLEPFFVNSVHGLDLALHVFGDLDPVSVERLEVDGHLLGITALLRSRRGDVVVFTAAWNTPANFALSVDAPDARLDVRPFELATLFDGVSVLEPTTEVPIRRYEPQVGERVLPGDEDLRFKPGFVAQARELAAVCRGETVEVGARLGDAVRVLQLAEALVGRVLPDD